MISLHKTFLFESGANIIINNDAYIYSNYKLFNHPLLTVFFPSKGLLKKTILLYSFQSRFCWREKKKFDQ